MKPKQENKTKTDDEITATTVTEEEKPKSAVGQFFSKIGYSIWVVVMVIGGVIAFLVSLFLI